MKMHHLTKSVFNIVFLGAVLCGGVAMAEPTLPEVYQVIESGQLAKADAMMKEVLQNHPNSAKAYYIASELNKSTQLIVFLLLLIFSSIT